VIASRDSAAGVEELLARERVHRSISEAISEASCSESNGKQRMFRANAQSRKDAPRAHF